MAEGKGIGKKILGFLSGGIGEGILGIVDKRIADKDLAEKLAHDVKVLLATQAHEAEMAALEVEAELEQSFDRRIEAELHQNDQYTKRTRPMIARQSWWAGLGYIAANVVTTIASPFITLERFDLELQQTLVEYGPIVPLEWGLLTAVFSPALTYMGVRAFDKWKNPAA